jgi:hypothetical protein
MNNHVISGGGEQVRGDAWILLSKLYCYLASPPRANCPQWLLPREYWKRQLDKDGAWFDKYMMTPCPNVIPWGGDGYVHWGPNTKNVNLHSATDVFEISFKEDYLGAVMGYMAWVASLPKYQADLGGWVRRFQWKVQWPIDRCSGLSGWDRRFPDIYYVSGFKDRSGNAVPLRTSDDAMIAGMKAHTIAAAADMAELWSLNKSLFDLHAPANRISMWPGVGPNYQCYMRMQLIYAQKLKLPNKGLAEAYAWLVPQVTPSEYRFALAD